MQKQRISMAVWAIFGSLVLGAPSGASAGDPDGFLYGRIRTTSGDVYEGQLRWGNEEAFWDDLFQSAKVDLPALDHVPRKERRTRRGQLEMFGFKMDWDDDGAISRQFAVRFGDMVRLEVTGEESATIVAKNGSEIEVEGYANDVGAEITVWDATLGKVDVRWNRIDTVEFLPTPASLRPEGRRLYGRVESDAGEFVGWIQWDKQECLTTDILDGSSRDGDLEIEMGRIRSIERRARHSLVLLEDGRSLDLDGTNDVDDSNRGILVEDERYGRIEVPWEAFESVAFETGVGSGRGYSTYGGSRALEATVRTADGKDLRGRIHFDLDESEGWELLNGSVSGVEFNVPFERIARVEPRGRTSARVQLRSGEEIRLFEGQDVSEANDGIVVLSNDEDGTYVRWEDVDRVEFHW